MKKRKPVDGKATALESFGLACDGYTETGRCSEFAVWKITTDTCTRNVCDHHRELLGIEPEQERKL